jgi:hypothetical protein
MANPSRCPSGFKSTLWIGNHTRPYRSWNSDYNVVVENILATTHDYIRMAAGVHKDGLLCPNLQTTIPASGIPSTEHSSGDT